MMEIDQVWELGYDVKDKFTCWYIHKTHTGLRGRLIATFGRRLEKFPLIVLPESINTKDLADTATYHNRNISNSHEREGYRNGWRDGYEAALQGGKKWTDEDMVNLLRYDYIHPISGDYENVVRKYTQSLQKIPKRVLVETKIVKSVTGVTITSCPNLPAISGIETKDIEIISTISTPEGEIIKALEVYYE